LIGFSEDLTLCGGGSSKQERQKGGRGREDTIEERKDEKLLGPV